MGHPNLAELRRPGHPSRFNNGHALRNTRTPHWCEHEGFHNTHNVRRQLAEPKGICFHFNSVREYWRAAQTRCIGQIQYIPLFH